MFGETGIVINLACYTGFFRFKFYIIKMIKKW
jgi:hypothetical protein